MSGVLAERSRPAAEEYHEMTEHDCWCNAFRALELWIVDEVLGKGDATAVAA